MSCEDRKSTWKSGVRKAIRRGSAEEEVRKHREIAISYHSIFWRAMNITIKNTYTSAILHLRCMSISNDFELDHNI